MTTVYCKLLLKCFQLNDALLVSGKNGNTLPTDASFLFLHIFYKIFVLYFVHHDDTRGCFC